jgi:hypothetical protein
LSDETPRVADALGVEGVADVDRLGQFDVGPAEVRDRVLAHVDDRQAEHERDREPGVEDDAATGDRVRLRQVLDTRESSSRPEMGIIRMKTRGLNEDGDEIVSWFRYVMIPKRTSGIGRDYFPQAKTGRM